MSSEQFMWRFITNNFLFFVAMYSTTEEGLQVTLEIVHHLGLVSSNKAQSVALGVVGAAAQYRGKKCSLAFAQPEVKLIKQIRVNPIKNKF